MGLFLCNLYVFWIMTLIFGDIMGVMNIFALYKIFADSGFKFKNDDEANNFYRELNVDSFDLKTELKKYLPMVNMIKQAKVFKELVRDKELLINILLDFELIEEMTDEEKKEYSKKKNVFNAIKINRNNRLKKNKKKSDKEYELLNVYVDKTDKNDKRSVKMKTKRTKQEIKELEEMRKELIENSQNEKGLEEEQKENFEKEKTFQKRK